MGIRLPSLLLVTCMLAACSNQAGAPRDIPVYDLKFEARSSGTALVAEGDTLGQIANRYALTLNDIIRANMISGTQVMAGQRLLLPPPRTYTVQSGDTIDRIARMFDTDMETLATANNLYPPYALQFGQMLQIPQDQQHEPIKTGDLRGPSTPAYDSIETQPLDSYKPQPDKSVMAEPLQPAPVRNTIPTIPTNRFARPLDGNVVSGFGPKAGGMYNDGINIAAKAGTPVSAAQNGIVAFAGQGPEGFGNMVLVKHDDGYFTVYSHLSQINVNEGASVPQGAMLGRVGATGKVKDPQLHFEIRRGTTPLNPEDYL
ncbi:MAG: LysM peptidoglycan-binding domain-containing protein [Proteobacteria bacterium]|nr:LysM peptidoglycan-binding domain-containing protein [Pseudomonadota bacterium]